MATDPSGTGIAAIAATLPVVGTHPVATLRDEAASALPALTALHPGVPATLAELSIAGKLIAELLQTSPSAAPAVHATPLLAAPTTQAAVIANALRQDIEHSGLFYESHLADWVCGRRKLESLAQEPQARSTAADELPAILRQQLELLDSQPLQWQIELWPGMPVRLQVEQQPADTHDGTCEAMPDSWTSTLVSQLPLLGSVAATLRIAGDRLQLKLHASGPASALLSERSDELRSALTAAGLQLQQFDTDAEASI